MSQYSDLLQHPKWQEKRLRILERDGFRCSRCEGTEKQLHVHHGYYARGRKPWEYEDDTLHTLCGECHEIVQATLETTHRVIGSLALDDLERVLGYAAGLVMRADPERDFHLASLSGARGIGDAWGLSDALVLAQRDDVGQIRGRALGDLSRVVRAAIKRGMCAVGMESLVG